MIVSTPLNSRPRSPSDTMMFCILPFPFIRGGFPPPLNHTTSSTGLCCPGPRTGDKYFGLSRIIIRFIFVHPPRPHCFCVFVIFPHIFTFRLPIGNYLCKRIPISFFKLRPSLKLSISLTSSHWATDTTNSMKSLTVKRWIG